MWLFVQSDTAKEGFTAAVGLAWQRVVHAANYLCDPAVSCRSPDMKLQLMRPDMVKKLAKGIKKIAGAPPHGARQMSSAVISCLLSLLYGTLVAGSPPEIGVLDSYPELDQNEQEVVYYVIGSMRKNLVKFRKLDVVTVGCLFGSRAEAETAGLPCRLTAEREKWGGLAYAKKELWACMHIVDRIFSKHCSAAALGRHGLEVHARLRAALAQHEGIAALFSAAAALCTPPIAAAALLSAVCETYAWSRQRVLVAQARSDLDLDHQNNKELRAKLGIAAQLKRDQRKIAKAASTAEKAVKAAARARKKSLSRPRAAQCTVHSLLKKLQARRRREEK
jgi:hypothetical protein